MRHCDGHRTLKGILDRFVLARPEKNKKDSE